MRTLAPTTRNLSRDSMAWASCRSCPRARKTSRDLKAMAEYDAALEVLEIAVGTYRGTGDPEGSGATAQVARCKPTAAP